MCDLRPEESHIMKLVCRGVSWGGLGLKIVSLGLKTVCIPRKLPAPDAVCGKENYGQIPFQEWADQVFEYFDRTQTRGPRGKKVGKSKGNDMAGAVVGGGKHSQQAGKLLEAPRSLGRQVMRGDGWDEGSWRRVREGDKKVPCSRFFSCYGEWMGAAEMSKPTQLFYGLKKG